MRIIEESSINQELKGFTQNVYTHNSSKINKVFLSIVIK